jgi:hypothetical protein
MHPTKWSQFLINQGKTPENNFVVLYGEKHGRPLDQTGTDMTPFSPSGLSGCGFWYFDPSTAFSNNPFYSLAGIQTSFVKAEQVLVGTFSDKIVDRILSHYNIELES